MLHGFGGRHALLLNIDALFIYRCNNGIGIRDTIGLYLQFYLLRLFRYFVKVDSAPRLNQTPLYCRQPRFLADFGTHACNGEEMLLNFNGTLLLFPTVTELFQRRSSAGRGRQFPGER